MHAEVISDFLRTQIGAGRSYSKINDKDVYKIRLELHLENDSFNVSSDTGHKGLRDGILGYILSKL